MRTAIITYTDKNTLPNLKRDFLETLRKTAKYKGEVYVIFYESGLVANKRVHDIPELLKKLPPEITHVMCIDGGDVWFQDKIDPVFNLTKDSFGYVEENQWADRDYNLSCIKRIKKQKIRQDILKTVTGSKLINAGMIVGKKEDLIKIYEETKELLDKINQDFFALDQTILNYVIRKNKVGINLPDKYNFCLITNKNSYKSAAIIHNNGGEGRLLPNGRDDFEKPLQIPTKLPGEFWGITTFFNPVGYKNKIKNYKTFRAQSKKQGLKLLTVELAFENKPFELKKADADILIQLRTNNVLWQKERMVNIGLKNLPESCDKFAWLDADIIFTNQNWVKETAKILEKYVVVQLFTGVIRLPKDKKNIDAKNIKLAKYVDEEGHKTLGIAFRVALFSRKILRLPMHYTGHSGFAWAARRAVFSDVGIFDKNIFPYVDFQMSHIFFNGKINKEGEMWANKHIKKALDLWSAKIYKKIRGSVFYVPGDILHLWHGNLSHRNYQECKKITKKYDFNPNKDIYLDKSGLWACDNEKFKKDMEKYFVSRNEIGAHHNATLPIWLEIDRRIGLVGIFLRKNIPVLFHFLNFLMRR